MVAYSAEIVLIKSINEIVKLTPPSCKIKAALSVVYVRVGSWMYQNEEITD
jgi:hypothetical protein